MSNPQNYMVNVTCPHCTTHLLVSISGFGGKLASRIKLCKKCKKEFIVNILATCSTELDETITDGRISCMELEIRRLNNQRKQTYSALLIKHEVAVKLYREALTEAEKMRTSHDLN